VKDPVKVFLPIVVNDPVIIALPVKGNPLPAAALSAKEAVKAKEDVTALDELTAHELVPNKLPVILAFPKEADALVADILPWNVVLPENRKLSKSKSMYEAETLNTFPVTELDTANDPVRLVGPITDSEPDMIALPVNGKLLAAAALSA
jgi:hypothetical protein